VFPSNPTSRASTHTKLFRLGHITIDGGCNPRRPMCPVLKLELSEVGISHKNAEQLTELDELVQSSTREAELARVAAVRKQQHGSGIARRGLVCRVGDAGLTCFVCFGRRGRNPPA